MSTTNGASSLGEEPAHEIEFIGGFTLRVYCCHGFPARFEAQVPEIGCTFTGISLAHVLSNTCQGLIYSLAEEERLMKQVRPARARGT